MITQSRTVVGVVALLIISETILAANAQPVDISAKVAALLDTSWQKTSPSEFAAAQQQYEQLKSAAGGDVRPKYAMALVAAKNYRSPEASQYLDEAPAGGGWVLPILKAKVWIAIVRKDDPAACRAIVELAKALAKDE